MPPALCLSPDEVRARASACRRPAPPRSEQESAARREYLRAWHKSNPKARAGFRIKHKYGLTQADVARMLTAQNGACALCERAFSPLPGTAKGSPVIDHDHSTGKVRSLLCWPCNTGLGQFRDSPKILKAAAAYVERHK